MPVERLSEVAHWRDVFAALDHADQWWSRWHKEGMIHRHQLQVLQEWYSNRRQDCQRLEDAGKSPPSDLGLPLGLESESVAGRTLRHWVFLQKEMERPSIVRLLTLAQLHAPRSEVRERQAAVVFVGGMTLTGMLFLAGQPPSPKCLWEIARPATLLVALGLACIHAERAFPDQPGPFSRKRFGLAFFFSGHALLAAGLLYREDLSLREPALSLGYVTAEQFDQWVRAEDMTHPLARGSGDRRRESPGGPTGPGDSRRRIASPSGLPFPKRLFLLIQFEPLPGGWTELGREGWVLQGARLVADGLVELARLGVRCGQGVQAKGVFPVGPLAGRGRVLDRPLAVADLVVRAGGQKPGEIVVGRNKSRLGLDGPEVSLLRLCVLALRVESHCEILMGQGLARVEFYRLPEGSHGPREVVARAQPQAQVAVGRGELRVELDSPPQGGEGRWQVPPHQQGDAQFAVRPGVSRVEFDRLVEGGDGPREVLVRAPPEAQVAVRPGVLRDEF